MHCLERLAQRDPPMSVRLPRASGQREERFMHLLGGPIDVEALAAATRASAAAGATPGSLGDRVSQLEQRVEQLEAALAQVQSASKTL
jgi:uncharacterized protein YceH (UPF0502 family)